MALTEQRRQQLDGIVSQMEANNESFDDIQFVVNDFKSKYENERPSGGSPPSPLPPPGGQPPQMQQQTFEERVQSDADRLAMNAQQSVENDPSLINRALAPTRQFTGTMAAHLNQALPYRAVAKGNEMLYGGLNKIGEAYSNLPTAAKVPFETAKAFGRSLPLIGQIIAASEFAPQAAESVEAIQQATPEKVKNVAGIGMDVLSMLPAAYAGKKAPGAVKATGKIVEKAGQSALGGQLKISKSAAAKGYGSRIDVKKENILKNISKYNLEDPLGNFNKMADKASALATKKAKGADNLLKKIASSPDAPQGNFVDDIISGSMDKIDDLAAIGQGDQAERIISGIIDDSARRGMGGKVGVDKIVEFKRRLDPDGNLFKSGPGISASDNLDKTIRKDLYRSSVDKIKEISPEASELNKQAKELIDISNVAADAASRTKNPNPIFSLSNTVVGGGGALAAAATKSPEVAAGTLGLLALKKASEQGRGPALLMKLGKIMQGKQPLPTGTLGDILGNQRGSTGGTKFMQNPPPMYPEIREMGPLKLKQYGDKIEGWRPKLPPKATVAEIEKWARTIGGTRPDYQAIGDVLAPLAGTAAGAGTLLAILAGLESRKKKPKTLSDLITQ